MAEKVRQKTVWGHRLGKVTKKTCPFISDVGVPGLHGSRGHRQAGAPREEVQGEGGCNNYSFFSVKFNEPVA